MRWFGHLERKGVDDWVSPCRRWIWQGWDLGGGIGIIIIIIIMSLTPVSSSDEDIGGVPSMQSSYSAGMKRCGICMEERSPLWVRRSKSEETLCSLLITMVEETFDIRRSWVDHGRPVMNLKSGYVEGENTKWTVKQRKMICGPFLIGYQEDMEWMCGRWYGKCLVYMLNGRCSGICEGTSYGQTSNPSLAWKKWMFSKFSK